MNENAIHPRCFSTRSYGASKPAVRVPGDRDVGEDWAGDQWRQLARVALGQRIEGGVLIHPVEASERKRRRVAIMYDRFGPYHIARLEAAQKLMDVVGLEVCGDSKMYLWDKVSGPCSFQRVTLFPNRTNDSVSLHELREAYKVLEKFHLDGVFLHGWAEKSAHTLLEWCLGCRIPMVVMSDSNRWDFPRVAWKEWVKRRIVGMCSAGFVAGRSSAEYLGDLGMSSARIFPGYDVVDNEYFNQGARDAMSKEEELRKLFGLPESYFLASARFIEVKNLANLIQAYARYRRVAGASGGTSEGGRGSREPWSLVLVGDGPLRPVLERLIGRLGLKGCVLMPGFKQYQELPVYYGLAKAFIHGSLHEPWGLVVNEAMASGLPLLLSNRCGCSADLVEEGGNGFSFDPLDVYAWAQLMLDISSEKVERTRMGRKSREIISRWGCDTFATGVRNSLEAALETPVFPRRSGILTLRACVNPLRAFFVPQ